MYNINIPERHLAGDHFGDLSIDGRILKWTLEKQDVGWIKLAQGVSHDGIKVA